MAVDKRQFGKLFRKCVDEQRGTGVWQANMRNGMCILLLFPLVVVLASELESQNIHHYVFFNRDIDRIADSSFLNTPAFEGAQLKFTWKELEPERNRYDFSPIQRAYEFLTRAGKRLFVQLQDVSFDSTIVNVPTYLSRDAEFHGGIDCQFTTLPDGRLARAGWVARRWDPAVQERMRRMFEALGAEFDGKIEGVNLPETALEFGENRRPLPEGFSYAGYRDAVIANMAAIKKAFPKSVVMIYSNFMPGEWLPSDDHSYLRSVYRAALELHVGIGGPDLLPYKKGQMNNGYQFLRQCGGLIPCGIAVQEGNYGYINPKTNKRVTIEELDRFASEFLHVHYVFWCTEEPYYSRDLVPFVRAIR